MIFTLTILFALKRADGCGGRGTGEERDTRDGRKWDQMWSLPTILSVAGMVCSLAPYHTPELPNTPGILLGTG